MYDLCFKSLQSISTSEDQQAKSHVFREGVKKKKKKIIKKQL